MSKSGTPWLFDDDNADQPAANGRIESVASGPDMPAYGVAVGPEAIAKLIASADKTDRALGRLLGSECYTALKEWTLSEAERGTHGYDLMMAMLMFFRMMALNTMDITLSPDAPNDLPERVWVSMTTDMTRDFTFLRTVSTKETPND